MINNTNYTISKVAHTTWWKISGIMTLYIKTMEKKCCNRMDKRENWVDLIFDS